MKKAGVRVVVVFTEEEVTLIDVAVETLNRKPGRRATRSDVIRVGVINYVAAIGDDAARAALQERNRNAEVPR